MTGAELCTFNHADALQSAGRIQVVFRSRRYSWRYLQRSFVRVLGIEVLHQGRTIISVTGRTNNQSQTRAEYEGNKAAGGYQNGVEGPLRETPVFCLRKCVLVQLIIQTMIGNIK